MTSNFLEIDGSVLEGGGQILRNAIALSTVCNIPINISNIRKGRSTSGLRPQHLSGVTLVKNISNASVSNATIGSEQLTFTPSQIIGGKYEIDTRTAGSVALLLQVALPVCYFACGPITLSLKGGTNCEMAPQIDFLTEVFRPNLEKFGATFNFDLIRRGYFPKGGGHISVTLEPVNFFKPVNLCDQGTVQEIFGWAFVAGSLPVQIAHDMANGAIRKFKQKFPNLNINIERYKEDGRVAQGNCSGIILVCTTSTGCVLGGSSLGNRKESSEVSGSKAADEILEALNDGGCVDKYVQDMLIIFMALAKGKSTIQVGEITLHTKTAIYVAEKMTKAKFNVKNIGNNTNIIECEGIGKENSQKNY